MIQRHDFSKASRDAFNAAVSLNVIDAVELGCLMVEHGSDAEAIMDEITECAFAQRHEGDKHGEWCRVTEAWAQR